LFDVDIDFADRSVILEKLKHRVAMLPTGKKHNTGIYPTEIPHNPINNCATIDYKEADQRGYFKLDFLNVSIYKDVRDEAHLNYLVNQEPLWDLLWNQEFSDLVFHLNGHSEILQKLRPRNVEQLAATLAIIRPAKRHLVDADWDTILREVWTKPENNDYYFKKSHSFSYAFAVIVHTNLICEKIST
jgi:hypothetical protein